MEDIRNDIAPGEVLRWRLFGDIHSEYRLERNGAPIVSLRRRSTFSIGRFVGQTPSISVDLRTKMDWSELNYRTTITNASTGEMLGEYITVHALDGDLVLKGRTYVLTRFHIENKLLKHFITDETGRKLAVMIRGDTLAKNEYEVFSRQPGDPDPWLLALILQHFIINFQGNG